MSRGSTREKVSTSHAQPTAKATTPSDQRLTILNERLEALRKTHLPPVPFLLAIQSRRQFHLSENQHNEIEERACGFKPAERDYQYLSFLETGWDNTIFTVLKPGERTNGVSKPQAMASANATPKTAAKKISIADYKKRSSLPQSVVNGSPAGDDIKNRAVSSTSAANQTSGTLKRGSDALERPKFQTSNGSEPPAKKLKPSPRLGPSESKTSLSKDKISLPPPLSPTLPAFVERLLAKSNESSSKGKDSDSNTALKKPKDLSERTKTSSHENSSSKRHDFDQSSKTASQSSKSTVNGIHRSVNNTPSKSNHTATVDSDTIRLVPRERSVSKPSVIVKLRIPRERRKDVSNLLKQPAKRLKERTPITKHSSYAEKTRPEKLPATSKPAEKRPREDDNLDVLHDRKRSRSPAQQERNHGKKPRESTPVPKEEVTTPQAATITGTPIPPTSAGRLGHKQTPSESGSAIAYPSSERLEGLQKLQTKYSELGRTLKKEGDKLSGPDMTPAQKRRFIASRIEVTLAFMLSYTIGDEVFRLRRRSPKPDATWNSLFVWMRSVHDLVHDHPHLSGLLLQLEAISMMVVWRQRSELAENSDALSLDKFKELRAQWEDSQRKFVKGAARLSVDDLQEEFPKTWKMKAREPLAHVGYRMAKDNLNGDFYLPLTSISLPIEGVRAGKTLLTEWCRREGVEWVAKLEF